jgi:hypothetical protein
MTRPNFKQYRIRNAALDEAEAFLMEFGKKAAEHDQLDNASTCSRHCRPRSPISC